MPKVDAAHQKRDNRGDGFWGCVITEKTPLLAISALPLDIWYEGPAFIVADKPTGMPLYPANAHGKDTLVNALLQSNRWLAEMETSHQPGVVHVLQENDRGLVLVGKTDEMAHTLREQHRQRQLTFSYRVRVPASAKLRQSAPVTIFDRRVYPDGTMLLDIDSPLGDTQRLREAWFERTPDTVFFVLYHITIPQPDGALRVALGERIPLPAIELYTAPPCSVCNGTKNFLTQNGFWYVDHDLTEPANVDAMRQLRGKERGIPVIQFYGDILVGFDRHRLKNLLSLH